MNGNRRIHVTVSREPEQGEEFGHEAVDALVQTGRALDQVAEAYELSTPLEARRRLPGLLRAVRKLGKALGYEHG